MKTIKAYFEKMGFRARMRLGTILVIFLVTGLGVSVSVYTQGQDQIRAMNDLGKYIAVNLSRNSVLGILSEEPANLEQPLNAAISEEQVMGVQVYLADGKIIGDKKSIDYWLDNLEISEQMALVNSGSQLPVAIETRTTFGQQLRSYLARVVIEKSDDDIFNIEADEEKFYGFVRVDMSLSELTAKKADILYQNILLTPIYILIGMAFSILIERRISRPLTQLKVAASKVAKEDFSTRIDVASEDELGSLASSFNEMSRQLSATIDKLNRANSRLEKANADLQDFTYIVSHDLQEPLRKVHSFGQFLVEDCGEQLSEEGRDYVNRMQNATVKMKQLIKDLLMLSKVGTGEESFEPVDSAGVVNEALDDLAIMVEEGQVEVVVGRMPVVLGNRTQLVQVFENLIGNAIKYRNTGRRLKIEIRAEDKNAHVVFSVKDNGIGIEEEFLERIFGVFQRLHSGNDKYKGTGIGLALCKKIVQRHGGEIWVESVLGAETTFYFTVPKAMANVGGVQK